MAKPVEKRFVCECGHEFGALVHQTANVTKEPELRQEILGGTFNAIKCPACGRTWHAAVPFLYHDMVAEMAVWVYPEGSVSQADEILAKIRRARVVLTASVGESLRPDGRTEAELVFGLAALARLIASEPAES